MGFLGDVDSFYKEVGEKFADLLPHFIHESSNFACQLYKKNPGIIYDLNFFNKGLWEKMCKDRPPGLPDPPSPDFLGGQCPVYYVFQVCGLAYGTIDRGKDKCILGRQPVLGALKNYRIDTYPYANQAYDTRTNIYITGGDNKEYLIRQVDTKGPWNEDMIIMRQDGQLDNCGSLPPRPIPPYPAPKPDRSANITYTFRDGTTVVIPIVLTFPVANNTFELKPSLTINAQVGGDRVINFHLYPDGWYSEPGHPDEPSPPDPRIDYFINPPNPDEDPLLEPSDPSPPAVFHGDEDVPDARWLRIVLTTFPDKAQYGSGTPTVYFAGWMEFTKGGSCFPRQQVNFQKSLFRFPDGADGYHVQFTNGAKGTVVVYTQVSENARGSV